MKKSQFKLITGLIILLLVLQGNLNSFGSFGGAGIFRHHKSVTFNLYGGDCKTCKKKIEKHLRRQNGVDSVIWDVKNQKLTVVFDPMVITSEEIIKIAASLGHDTDTIKASDEAFQSLEECCKYERKI